MHKYKVIPLVNKQQHEEATEQITLLKKGVIQSVDAASDFLVNEEIEIIPEIPVITLDDVAAEDVAVPEVVVPNKVEFQGPAQSSVELSSGFLDGPDDKGDEYDKYRKMIRCGIAQGAVEQKMRHDGIDSSKISTTQKNEATSAVSFITEESNSNAQMVATNDGLEKYRKMVKCGLPIGAAKQRMKLDGLDPNLLNDSFPELAPSPAVVVKDPSAATSVALESTNIEIAQQPASIEIDSKKTFSNEARTDSKLVELSSATKPSNEIASSTSNPLTDNSSLSPSKQRAALAEGWVQIELHRLISEIQAIGERHETETVVLFKLLFERYEKLSDSLVGILSRAKKRGLVEFKGEILYQGKDNQVPVILVHENVEKFERGEPTRPRLKVEPEASSALSPQKAVARVPIAKRTAVNADASSVGIKTKTESNDQQKSPQLPNEASAKPETVQNEEEEVKTDFATNEQVVISAEVVQSKDISSSTDQQACSSGSEIGMTFPSMSQELTTNLPTSSTFDVDNTVMENARIGVVSSNGEEEHHSSVTGRGPPPQPPSEQKEIVDAASDQNAILVNENNSGPDSAISNFDEPSIAVWHEPEQEEQSSFLPEPPLIMSSNAIAIIVGDAKVDGEEDDTSNDVTGRGPPPQPPVEPGVDLGGSSSACTMVANEPRQSISTATRRKTHSIVGKNRSPSKASAPIEPMFDMYGRRRSSGTIYRVALNVMDSKSVQTIPRDEITDALNWTSESSPQKNGEVFSFENAEGVALGKVLDSLKSMSQPVNSKRRRSPSHDNTGSRSVRNQTQAVVLIQRIMRGWMTRVKYRSCLWVRARLNSAVQSRLPEKVEEALAASRAISVKFVRPPEHEVAIASLDTIREERALRPKIIELAEGKVNQRDGIRKYASVIERMARCSEFDKFAFTDEVAVRAQLVYEAMIRKAEIWERLVQAKVSMLPSNMMDALHECDAAGSKYAGIWEESFLEEEKSELRRILVGIQHEEPAIIGLLKACTSNDLVFAHPEMIFQKANFEELEDAIAKAVDDLGHAPLTPGASLILSFGSSMLVLKKSLSATQNAPQKPHGTWNICEKLLGDARTKLRTWADSIPSSQYANDTADYFASWIAVMERELDLVSQELDKKAGVHDLIAAFYDSVQRCDIDDIRNILRKGERRGLYERVHDAQLQEHLKLAQEYLERFSLIHARLAESLSGVNRNPVELKRVADEAREQVLSNSSDALLVAECDRLCAYAKEELLSMIEKALHDVPERAELEELVVRIRKVERMGGMEELQAIENLLAMSDARLLQEQLRATSRTHDESRKTKITIKLRILHLEQNPAQFRFENYGDLKDPKEWAMEVGNAKRGFASAFSKREAKAARMLYSSRTPIHAPLTKTVEADSRVRRVSLRANRTLLAYTRDFEVDDLAEFGGDLCQGLRELLVYALGEKQIRDEIYCQIMKHLTENRRPGSVTRTWNFFAFCLLTFPPSPCLDHFVEVFIRKNAPAADKNSLLDKLYGSVFVGERPTAPTLSDIKNRQDDGGSVEGLNKKLGLV